MPSSLQTSALPRSLRRPRVGATAALAVMLGLATGCAGGQSFLGGPKQTGGALAGAAAGGLLGNQIGGGGGKAWATGLGIAAGGLLGNEVGKSLDRADRAAGY